VVENRSSYGVKQKLTVQLIFRSVHLKKHHTY